MSHGWSEIIRLSLSLSSSFDYCQVVSSSVYKRRNHYRKPDICRVLKALPRAIYRALGKVTICRVPTERHSATKRHSAKICFAECLFTDTRQTCLCRVPRGQHSAHSLTCAPHTPAAPVTCHGRYCLPSATQRALGKDYHVRRTRPLLCCHERYTVAKTVTVIVC